MGIGKLIRWYWAYSYIRKCNEILQNIDDVTMDEKLKDRMKGETLFFRATAYFKMVIRYGGVPLILEPQTFDSEDLYPKRASVDEIFDFVTKEYEKAAGFLSEFKTQDSNNFGRVTWGACKAMEARAFYSGPAHCIILHKTCPVGKMHPN